MSIDSSSAELPSTIVPSAGDALAGPDTTRPPARARPPRRRPRRIGADPVGGRRREREQAAHRLGEPRPRPGLEQLADHHERDDRRARLEVQRRHVHGAARRASARRRPATTATPCRRRARSACSCRGCRGAPRDHAAAEVPRARARARRSCRARAGRSRSARRCIDAVRHRDRPAAARSARSRSRHRGAARAPRRVPRARSPRAVPRRTAPAHASSTNASTHHRDLVAGVADRRAAAHHRGTVLEADRPGRSTHDARARQRQVDLRARDPGTRATAFSTRRTHAAHVMPENGQVDRRFGRHARLHCVVTTLRITGMTCNGCVTPRRPGAARRSGRHGGRGQPARSPGEGRPRIPSDLQCLP